jgi:hypothetical protein
VRGRVVMMPRSSRAHGKVVGLIDKGTLPAAWSAITAGCRCRTCSHTRP